MTRDNTKNQILDSAIELFWQRSYHASNMNALARAAGVNKATIYQHFASKEELAVAAIARAAEHTEAHVYRASFDGEADPAERLRRIFQNAWDIHAAICARDGHCRGCPFLNIGVELATTSEAVRHAVNAALARFTGYFRRIAAAAPGALGPDETARELMAVMNASLIASKLENDPAPILTGQARALRLIGA